MPFQVLSRGLVRSVAFGFAGHQRPAAVQIVGRLDASQSRLQMMECRLVRTAESLTGHSHVRTWPSPLNSMEGKFLRTNTTCCKRT